MKRLWSWTVVGSKQTGVKTNDGFVKVQWSMLSINLMYQITFREGIIIGTSIYGNIQGRTRLNTSEASNRY